MIHKSIPEVERAIRDVNRPMRWSSAEELAQKFLKAVLDKWIKLEKDLFKVIKEISENSEAAEGTAPLYQSLLNYERSSKVSDFYDLHQHDDHYHLTQKRGDVTRGELSALLGQLSQYLSIEQVAAIEAVFLQYSPEFMDKPFSNTGPIFNKYYPQVIQDGYNEAWNKMEAAAKNQGALSKLNEFSPVYGFSYDTPFVTGFLERGFQLVTSKITIAAQGAALAEMLTGFENGDTWTTIARNIHEVVGVGYRYHWKRLVRTEMTSAYYESMTHRYQETGIEYVKLSLSMGACPICSDLEGFYTLGFEPSIPEETHPNCRCVYFPYWRLPVGVTVLR